MIYVSLRDIDTLVNIISKLKDSNHSFIVKQTNLDWIITID
jgi:acetolactate synthase regulatory subunit